MHVGGMALSREPHDCRHGENNTQAPQDSLPFAITPGQHSAVSGNPKHAAQREPRWRPHKIFETAGGPAGRYAL